VFLSSNGEYQGPTFYQVSAGNGSWTTSGLALGDLNGDGKPDVAVASVDEQLDGVVSVFMGNGNGTFQAPQIAITMGSGEDLAGSIAIGDFNGDGKGDLAYFYNNVNAPIVAVALGAGNGTFSTPQPYSVNGTYFTLADVNGDGNLDIVTDGVSILYGDGKGGFPRRRDVASPVTGAVILTDFDGDGIPDIVAGTGTASVLAGDALAVLRGKSDGSFVGEPVTFVAGLSTPAAAASSIATADFNGDGIPDVALAFGPYDGTPSLVILNGNGDGTLAPGFTAPLAGMPDQTLIADFNHDGKPDLAILESYENTLQIFLGQGNGTFSSPASITLPNDALALAVGDFNGDGKLDLAFATSTGAGNPGNGGVILLGNGDGTFTSPLTFRLAFAPAWMAVGDFNSDGKLDLAFANQGTDSKTDGSLAILFGKGDGTFGSATTIPLSYGPSVGPIYVYAADLNRDGKLDLVAMLSSYQADFSAAAVLLGNGDGTFQPAVAYPASGSAVGVADVNGDKIPDLITEGGYLIGEGDGTFQPLARAPVSPGAIADYNGDGKPDFASVDTIGVGVALNLSPAASGPPLVVYSAASLTAGPLAPESLATAFGVNLGATVSVVDSAGTPRSATTIYTSPQQINFQVPAGTATGLATVTISGTGVPTVSTQVQIASVAPTLFQLNAGGLAAAYALNVSSGVETYEPVYTLLSGYIVPAPIALAGQTYLILYGTGIRGANGECTAWGDFTATVTYAGPDPQFPGVDQVNLVLPATIESGYTAVTLTCAGTAVNTVYIDVQ
jgi:uncharacterized protein (TIGR03437 family)